MINLLQSNIDIKKAEKEHLDFFKCYVTKRLTGRCGCTKTHKTKMPNRKDSYKSKHFSVLIDFVISDKNLELILKGSPKEIQEVNQRFIEKVNSLFNKDNVYDAYIKSTLNKRKEFGEIHEFFNDVKAVFNYDWYNSLSPNDEYSPYKHTKNLGVRSCVYCNRTYTITRRSIENGKLMRPQLDHWFPKSKFPLLAISFYNLIPCCSYCNSSVKGDVVLELDEHIHPYVIEDDFDELTFDFSHFKHINEYKIFLKKPFYASGKSLATIKKLKIDQMYNGHHSELEDMLKLKQAYSDSYIEKISNFFPKTGLTKEETFRLLFGTELNDKNFHRRPMSKFKYDILKEIDII